MAELRLDWKKIEKAREAASAIAGQVTDHLAPCTTVAVERAVCRLYGIDGVDAFDVPLANLLIDHLRSRGVLEQGASYWLAQAALSTGLAPAALAEAVAAGSLDLTAHEKHDAFACELWAKKEADTALSRIRRSRAARQSLVAKYSEQPDPWLYAIVATGNIYEDMIQARAAAGQGADVIAVIRTTGQSLLDYVPYGATTEGFGGTTATQENFRLMRQALDEKGEELGRYIRLCNYCSGLCMPEIAVMGAFERLDVMLNDALYGILFRDINMQRTLIDQSFSRMINGAAGIIINTGEDNYLTTADAFEEAHTVLASQFINEQFALRAGMREEQMGLGHAFEMDPVLPDSFVYELAQAQMARQLFPDAPLKYMP
ncbi:MAG: D-lysine 5,6-aminomutase subunit alpha, partial [Clostridiaceae bacterium]|nr:D-lysine 5,6-aminomutase subunit alpha [Clostridiaceae bacterium]